MTPNEPVILGYGKQLRSARRAWRWAAVIVLLAGGLLAHWSYVAEPGLRRYGLVRRQADAVGYVPAAREIGSPDPWVWYAVSAGLPQNGIVYLGRRTSPGGKVRIVVVCRAWGDRVVSGAPPPPGTALVGLAGFAATPSALTGDPPVVLTPGNPAVGLAVPSTEDPVLLFAGRADPNDPGRFTIDGAAGEFRFTIDGWLQDDETVRLQPRDPAVGTVPVQLRID